MALINIASVCALVGAGFYAATLLMRTMVVGTLVIVSALFFMAYGALAGAISTFLVYLLLLPINGLRLIQLRNLIPKKARVAAQGDLSMDWLKPFMNRRNYRRGDVLFRKGQPANEMYLTVTGKFLVKEIGVEIPPGRIMGELGFLTPNNRRTQTIDVREWRRADHHL